MGGILDALASLDVMFLSFNKFLTKIWQGLLSRFVAKVVGHTLQAPCIVWFYLLVASDLQPSAPNVSSILSSIPRLGRALSRLGHPTPSLGEPKLSQAPPFSVVVHSRDVFGCKKRPRLVSLIFNHMTSYRGVTSGNEHRNDNWNEMVR